MDGHDRELTAAAEQARAAARQARDSLRWNPRAVVERSVPRPSRRSEHELTQARDRQRQLERRVGQPPADSGQSGAVRHLARLTGNMIRELAGDAGQPVPPSAKPSGAAGIPAS